MMAGYINGSGVRKGPEGDDKVASLDEARRRAAARAKEAAKEEKRNSRDRRAGRMTPRDWVVGGMIIVMALGMVWHWVSPLVGATGATR